MFEALCRIDPCLAQAWRAREPDGFPWRWPCARKLGGISPPAVSWARVNYTLSLDDAAFLAPVSVCGCGINVSITAERNFPLYVFGATSRITRRASFQKRQNLEINKYLRNYVNRKIKVAHNLQNFENSFFRKIMGPIRNISVTGILSNRNWFSTRAQWAFTTILSARRRNTTRCVARPLLWDAVAASCILVTTRLGYVHRPPVEYQRTNSTYTHIHMLDILLSPFFFLSLSLSLPSPLFSLYPLHLSHYYIFLYLHPCLVCFTRFYT